MAAERNEARLPELRFFTLKPLAGPKIFLNLIDQTLRAQGKVLKISLRKTKKSPYA